MNEEEKQYLKDVITVTEKEDWTVNLKKDSDGKMTHIIFENVTPANHIFEVGIDISDGNVYDICNRTMDFYSHFDVSEEAYKFLGKDGHGIDGAPYDMRDVYDDMCECKKMIWKLYECIFYWENGEDDDDDDEYDDDFFF